MRKPLITDVQSESTLLPSFAQISSLAFLLLIFVFYTSHLNHITTHNHPSETLLGTRGECTESDCDRCSRLRRQLSSEMTRECQECCESMEVPLGMNNPYNQGSDQRQYRIYQGQQSPQQVSQLLPHALDAQGNIIPNHPVSPSGQPQPIAPIVIAQTRPYDHYDGHAVGPSRSHSQSPAGPTSPNAFGVGFPRPVFPVRSNAPNAPSYASRVGPSSLPNVARSPGPAPIRRAVSHNILSLNTHGMDNNLYGPLDAQHMTPPRPASALSASSSQDSLRSASVTSPFGMGFSAPFLGSGFQVKVELYSYGVGRGSTRLVYTVMVKPETTVQDVVNQAPGLPSLNISPSTIVDVFNRARDRQRVVLGDSRTTRVVDIIAEPSRVVIEQPQSTQSS